MHYLSGVFLLCNQSQITCLQWLQNRSIHVTKCLRKYDHTSELYQQLNRLYVLGLNPLVPCFVTTIIIVSHVWFSIHRSYLDSTITITHIAKIASPICKLIISPPPKTSFTHLPLPGGILWWMPCMLNLHPQLRTFIWVRVCIFLYIACVTWLSSCCVLYCVHCCVCSGREEWSLPTTKDSNQIKSYT